MIEFLCHKAFSDVLELPPPENASYLAEEAFG